MGDFCRGTAERLTSKSSATLQVALEDDSGRDFIDEGLVLTVFLLQAAIDHCPMGEHGGETLIHIFYGDGWLRLSPTVDKLLHAGQILTWLPIRLHRLTNDDALYRLLSHIGHQIIVERGCRNSRQPSGYNLQRIGDCYSCTSFTVIYRKDSRHLGLLLIIEQPSIGILTGLEAVTAAHGTGLIVVGSSHHAIHVAGTVVNNLCIIASVSQCLLETFGISLYRERTNHDAEIAEAGTIDELNALLTNHGIVNIVNNGSLGRRTSHHGSHNGRFRTCVRGLLDNGVILLSLGFLISLAISAL